MYITELSIVFFLIVFNKWSFCERFAHIDDTNFAIKWPGPLDNDLNNFGSERSMVVKSAEDELYFCVLPENVRSSSEEEIITYDGPNEYVLLQPLFDQTTCSYRIESYWTYELCHGKHLRQYHEDKEVNQKVKLQEYMLGKFDREKGMKDYIQEKASDKIQEPQDTLKIKTPKKVSVVNVEGLEFPFFQFNFTDGTPCDLTSTPRKSFMKYVCHHEGRGEIYEIKELSTCEYQVIVLTSQLCNHPAYRQKTQPVNEIQCHSMKGAPSLPKTLQQIEEERSQSQYSSKKQHHRKVGIKVNINGDVMEQEIDLEEEDAAGEDNAEIDITTYQPTHSARTTHGKEGQPRTSTTISANTDMQLIKEFLSGDYCLTGGTGWWKYEFCFGKKAIQFHEEKQTNQRTVIVLGKWDKDSHLRWIEDNPSKKPKPKGDKARRSISNMYVQGDICDLNKKPRFAEVKLKCKENPSQPHSVSIYLVEPNACEYVLVVESPLLCSVIDQADENGIIDVPKVKSSLQKP